VFCPEIRSSSRPASSPEGKVIDDTPADTQSDARSWRHALASAGLFFELEMKPSIKIKSPSLADAGFVPLCVDLDGTLVRTDTLAEAVLALVRERPLYVFLLPVWLIRGRAYLKQQVVKHVSIDVSLLPFHTAFLAFLREEQASGRRIFLATAADHSLAQKISDHLGVFSGVLASNGTVSLKANAKKQALVEMFGEGGYDYAGNGLADAPVWAKARKIILVQSPGRVPRRLRNLSRNADQHFRHESNSFRLWWRELRTYQWAKNLLLFVPAVLAHRIFERGLLQQLTIAFLAFGLAASGVYILNDLLDLSADRKHPAKKSRPFASGDLSLSAGAIAIPVLWLAAFAVAVALPGAFSLVLAAYVILSISYSLYFKGQPLLDILLLAALYGLRISAGAVAGQIRVSPWLLMFSIFFFFSLAAVKRYTELMSIDPQDQSAPPRRAYFQQDSSLLTTMGVASGFVSALVIALYLQSPETSALYAQPDWLWLVCPVVLYWISRVWLLARRSLLHHDPVVFALHDGVSYVICAAVGLLLFLAS
jgi:4-hydroxybenzoate polyprenyltransferase